MNEKVIDILKYFLLTFASLELMYYVAKSSFNLPIVLLIAVGFTVLYTMDKYKVLQKFLSQRQNLDKKPINKNQSM